MERRGAPRISRLVHKTVLLAAVIGPLVATAYAIVLLWNRLVTWRDLAILGGMYAATAMGITVGYHRLLTHRSFEAPWPVRGLFLALGSMALQGSAIEWAATHLKHHAKADDEGDPHSPLEGLFHAHLGWLFRDRFVRDGVWARPFRKDPLVVFMDRTFLLWAGLGFAIPYWLGGWTGLLWGGFVRVFLVHHVTWSVNSVCHAFGRKDFDTPDESRNQWVVGLLGLGEGWHNNHHAFPQSAYHGLRWWQVDASAYLIRLLAAVGLARNVKRPRAADIEARAARPPGGEGEGATRTDARSST